MVTTDLGSENKILRKMGVTVQIKCCICGYPDAGEGGLPCFGCDCGIILEILSILFTKQDVRSKEAALAEGGLDAGPSGCHYPAQNA